MSIIGLIITLILVGFALYLVQLIPMDATIKKVITAVVILIAVLWLLQTFGVFTMGPRISFR